MAYNPITAAEINEIKQRVKNEMLRRTGYGSLEQYGNSNYDFDEIPITDGKVLAEHKGFFYLQY